MPLCGLYQVTIDGRTDDTISNDYCNAKLRTKKVILAKTNGSFGRHVILFFFLFHSMV